MKHSLFRLFTWDPLPERSQPKSTRNPQFRGEYKAGFQLFCLQNGWTTMPLAACTRVKRAHQLKCGGESDFCIGFNCEKPWTCRTFCQAENKRRDGSPVTVSLCRGRALFSLYIAQGKPHMWMALALLRRLNRAHSTEPIQQSP